MDSPISSYPAKRPVQTPNLRPSQPYLQLFSNSASPVKINHSSSFKTLKLRPNYQSDVPMLKDVSVGPPESSDKSPVSVNFSALNESSARNRSPAKKRIWSGRAASSYKPSLNKTTSLLFTNKKNKLRPDSSLSSILSLAKEEDLNKMRPIMTPKKPESREKSESINSQVDLAFVKKEDPFQKKFRKSRTSQLLKSTLDSAANQSNLLKGFKISSFFTPKANNSLIAGKVGSPNSQSIINCSMNEPLALTFDQEKTPKSKSTFNAFGRKGSDLAEYFKVSSKRESLAQVSPKPSTAPNSSGFKRPMTAQKPSKIKNGIYRLGAHNPTDNEKDRLNNFIETKFHEDLIYTDSYQNIPEKTEEPEVQTLEEAKKYIFEKKQAGNKVHQSILEYRSNQEALLQNQSPSNRGRIEIDLSPKNILEDNTTPQGIPRMRDFELFNAESGVFRDIPSYQKFISQNTSPKNFGMSRERTKNFMISDLKPSYSQLASQLTTPKSIIFKEKTERNDATQRSSKNQLPNKFSEMQKKRFKRIRKSLKFLLERLARLNISLKEAVEEKAIPQNYYEREGSETFIKAVKRGELEKVRDFLDKNKLYVCEFDSTKQTALHWAAKRGYSSICELLLNKGAGVDVLDLTSKTPLYYALREGNPTIVRMLLSLKANPWSNETTSYRNICDDPKCLRFLNRARQISVLQNFSMFKKNEDFWVRAAENAFPAPAFYE